jgi:hypothetical protein
LSKEADMRKNYLTIDIDAKKIVEKIKQIFNSSLITNIEICHDPKRKDHIQIKVTVEAPNDFVMASYVIKSEILELEGIVSILTESADKDIPKQ